MSRQLRIEYSGAFYHVYSRGNQKQTIYFSDDDRFFFLKILRDANERLGAIWHLYCLMNSHYHLGLETPGGNLSQIMHLINSAYSIHLNLKYGRCGHLFQGRFKAILVQADLYARTLAKYIHHNPVRRRIVDRPEEYEWSSCQVYYGLRESPAWLRTDIILACFGNSRNIQRTEHERYLGTGADTTAENAFRKASRLGIMGDDDFVDKIRREFLKERLCQMDGELCELKRLRTRPELARIRDEVERELGQKSKLIKKCTIFLAHKHADYRLREIGDLFGIGPTAVSVAFRKTAKEIVSNGSLQNTIELVRNRLFEGRRPRESEKV